MVSKAGTKRKQPKWIGNTVWGKMCDYWITEEAKAKHDTTSAARMSDRNGQGIHKHVSGQKSFLQVEQELEVTLGRPPTVAEVFVKTHTKKDGSFVDQRAQEVFDLYKQKKEAKLAELEHENDESADGTSPRSQLSLEEDNEVFYKSTVTNDRGQMYGLGSLETYINGKRKYPSSSSSFTTVNQQLEDANRKIEEITALQAQREAEHLRVTSALQAEVKGLGVVKKYLRIKDPDFLAFLADEEDPSNPPL